MPTIPPRLPRSGAVPLPAATSDRDRGHVLSRRSLLVGAAGIVTVGGGLAAAYAADQLGRSSTPAGATPTATTPTTTAPAGTDPAIAAPPATSAPTTTGTSSAARVLVVVQLSGGNDALNTLVPISGAYHDARPTLGLADDTLVAVPFTTDYGLHPALAPLAPLLEVGHVGIVAGVGFPAPTRSHFSALDMWWAGRPEASATGWLGRWLDLSAPPSPAVLRATGLGGAVPALGAETARSVGVTEIDRFAIDATGAPAELVDAWTAMSAANRDARAAAEVLAGFAAATNADEPSTTATALLAVAAQLVASEPGVEVIHVVVPGFDTHSGQLAVHEALLADVATGIAGFQAAITASGDAHRVLLLTTSEFGRRVAENGSIGTDHGKAGAQLLVSAAISRPGVHGGLDLTDLDDGDLRPVVDPRSLYATALDWLDDEVGSPRSDEVIGAAFERLPFLG